ncbi:MAG: hypothetical protein ACRDJP_13540, partial [Actinomycetota bacterium]
MTAVLAAALRHHERAVPVALLYVGLPAYFVVAAISVWDIFDSRSTPVAVAALGAIVLLSFAFMAMAVG